MHDFSRIDDLRPLARLVRQLRAASGTTTPFVIAGAQARDLLLKYGHNIDTGRQTSDVDFAFRVASWEEFHQLRNGLIKSGEFSEVPKTVHKLRFRGGLEVDIVPFGGIESRDRTITWPPDRDFVMSLFGFREAFDSAISISLPEAEKVSVVSLPALALLKLEAWKDRRMREPGKDAHDLRLILCNYLTAGNSERLYSDFASLLDERDFDYEQAGAFILGNDVAGFLDLEGRERVGALLASESDSHGPLRLIGDMRIEPEVGLQLLNAMRTGFHANGDKAT